MESFNINPMQPLVCAIAGENNLQDGETSLEESQTTISMSTLPPIEVTPEESSAEDRKPTVITPDVIPPATVSPAEPATLDDADSDIAAEPEAEEENYGMNRIQTVMATCRDDPDMKPSLSYIALISLAVGSTEKKRMLLSEIYAWIAENFPYYRSRDRSWRNSIRHNLSLNECFIKAGRSENGKGNYWAIHHANVDDFSSGDFRRRRARRRVRKCNEELERIQLGYSTEDPKPDPYFNPGYNGYVMMTSTQAPAHALIRLFGADMILSKEERVQEHFLPHCGVPPQFPDMSALPTTANAADHQYQQYTESHNTIYHSNSHGYGMTQYSAPPEVDFPALVSATDTYRNADHSGGVCQLVTSLKAVSSTCTSVRYSPY